ncbi:MAG: hypothetical protein AAF551_03395 [Bacteroidota bacterium]
MNLGKLTHYFLGLVLLLAACDESAEEPVLQEPDLTVKNGILHFKDLKTFETYMNTFNEMDDTERLDFLSSIGFVNTLYAKIQSLENSAQPSDNELDVPDPAFSMILNEEGLYSIGDMIHKITDKEEIMVEQEAYAANMDWSGVAATKKIPIYFGENDYSHSQNLDNARKDDPIKLEPYDGDFVTATGGRIRGIRHLSAHIISWNRTYFAYASAGLRIKGRKKDGRKWRDDKMHYAAISYLGNATIITPDGTRIDQPDKIGRKDGRDKKSISKTIYSSPGIDHKFDEVRFDADFTYEDDGYERVFLNNQIFILDL